MKKVVVSGGFDPIHIGHLRLFENAKKLGDHLNVILNTDEFLIEKKGFRFMDFEERKEIILGFACVDEVTKSIDSDNTVCKTIELLKSKNDINIFANGGDRKNIEDIPEYKICLENEIEMIFDIGGEKIQSSSDLTKNFLKSFEERPWGKFENFLEEKSYLIKRLTVNPNQKISLQYHKDRCEFWVVVSGSGVVSVSEKKHKAEIGSHFFIDKMESHRLENVSNDPLVIIEVQLGGNLSEDDIVRIQDEYGRK